VEGIEAQPLESNILEWRYVLHGPKGTPYEGGVYQGRLIFPQQYPYKPPRSVRAWQRAGRRLVDPAACVLTPCRLAHSIMMLTPNGRFRVDTR
jgi:ubiquitin-protein ligase